MPDREAIVHYASGEATHRWTWAALLTAAQGFAARLAERGIRRGDVCALIVRHHPDFYPLYMGIEALGAIPSVLAYPNPRLHPDKFRDGLAGMARVSGLDWILTEEELEPVLAPLVTGSESTIRGLHFPFASTAAGTARAIVPPAVAPDEPCLLQHSSGTTGLQKAVMLSQLAVLEHVRRYGDAIRLTADDRIVSWLPLYHDMGLIAAFHLPLASGVPVIAIDPFEWVAAPVLFLDACTREHATLAWLPNFAYNLMASRIRDEDLQGIRLDSIRLLVNCSEPVRADSHDQFATRFAPYGLDPRALSACYAMAETTFAVTQTAPGARARTVCASRDALARGFFEPTRDAAQVRRCVSSGRPVDGCELRVVDNAGRELPDGHVGELWIRSVSMFAGYRNNPEKTAEVLRDGWYDSGDYGFLLDGECYVVGRRKDLIIVAGKNIYPEDVEDAVNTVAGVLPGRVVAFGVEDVVTGTESIHVVAETRHTDTVEQRRLRGAIIEAGMRVDVTIADVHLVPPRWLIKSSAGKPSRRANKDRVLAEIAQSRQQS